MKRCLLILFSFVINGFVACKKEKEDLALHDVTSVSGLTSGSINAAIVLSVRYFSTDGCDAIGSVKEERNGNVITIKSYNVPLPKNAFCTLNAGFKTIDYSFISSATGNFQL